MVRSQQLQVSFGLWLFGFSTISTMLKTNTSLKYLMLYELGLTDWTATHIAAGLVDNHSLEKLGISKNKTTSVGAASIFKALEFNNTLKSLGMHYVCLGVGAQVAKVDLKSAFRMAPVHRDDWELLEYGGKATSTSTPVSPLGYALPLTFSTR